MLNRFNALAIVAFRQNAFVPKGRRWKSMAQQKLSGSFKKYMGQPTYDTHPHLIGKGEVIPLITLDELNSRRSKLVNSIIKTSHKLHPDLTNHLIVIPGATKKYMSDKIPYVFRQNSDYLYLSGCQEPDTCLILSAVNCDFPQFESILFLQDHDSHSELWNGPHTAPEDALHLFGVDKAMTLSELPAFLKSFVDRKDLKIWFDFGAPVLDNIQVHRLLRELVGSSKKAWESPVTHLHKLRVIKSKAEIALMSKACEIASDAIIQCMRVSQPGISERELFATVDYECRKRGAEILAYPPVVAGGDRATIIHYINNNQLVHNGELILMDAGCEYHGYSSDITRTWPINGNFSKAQRELYEIVLSVQQDLLQMLKNLPSLDKLLDSMYLLLGKRLQEIGLVKKTTSEEAIMKGGYQFCPHHVSHYLGMDVHDTPTITRTIDLKPGMIVTVEPGIYINHHHSVPPEYRGIGIRIEDDILITEGEPIVLTSRCPKSISDIENISSYAANK